MHVSSAFMHYFKIHGIQGRQVIGFKKILAIIHMPILKPLMHIHVFIGITQYYQCFVKDFAFIITPITKLLCKI
jgi:hypothetical protein